MLYGERISKAESVPENVHKRDAGAGPSRSTLEDVNTPNLQEKTIVLEGIKRIMDGFRRGDLSLPSDVEHRQ